MWFMIFMLFVISMILLILFLLVFFYFVDIFEFLSFMIITLLLFLIIFYYDFYDCYDIYDIPFFRTVFLILHIFLADFSNSLSPSLQNFGQKFCRIRSKRNRLFCSTWVTNRAFITAFVKPDFHSICSKNQVVIFASEKILSLHWARRLQTRPGCSSCRCSPPRWTGDRWTRCGDPSSGVLVGIIMTRYRLNRPQL